MFSLSSGLQLENRKKVLNWTANTCTVYTLLCLCIHRVQYIGFHNPCLWSEFSEKLYIIGISGSGLELTRDE